MRKVKLLGLCLLVLLLSMALVVGCSGTKDEGKAPEEGKDAPKEVTVDPNYPSSPITYLIPFDPGGQSDVEARRQQPLLEKILGTSVIVTYKAGGGGAVGWSELVNHKPDGYFMAGINVPHIILQPLSRDNAGYKTEQIEPVAFFQRTPVGLAVQKDSPFDTLEEFIEYAKANPGAVTVGGSGTFSGHHIAAIEFEALTGVTLTYVPFTGAAPQMQAFLGKHVAAVMANSDALVQYEDSMKILAFGGTERFEALPDVPTFIEKGYDMIPSIDRGVAVPPGTPEEYKKKLSDAFMEVANDENLRKQMIEQGFVPVAMDMNEAQAYLDEMTKTYTELLESLK
ncbi:tripartite tricarboxylate transporter substrate binding protein [Desulfitibacter alkalitolerans]|uniref:tripartite tricarboxylate transporter substrate binding protein n=1 Tax=Desulfitibacter alkalitolerans TaxID=264641 RepID=UPI000687D5B6|nr:tripartite tricarboxylate transporter substrate binding protein [Desulfitibacter alkalitolerans]